MRRLGQLGIRLTSRLECWVRRCQAPTVRSDQTTSMTNTTARLSDVAAAAGVDASVVSRVLSGDTRLSIRPETRQRVLEAAARLNYRPEHGSAHAEDGANDGHRDDRPRPRERELRDDRAGRRGAGGHGRVCAAGRERLAHRAARRPPRADRRTSRRDGDERDAPSRRLRRGRSGAPRQPTRAVRYRQRHRGRRGRRVRRDRVPRLDRPRRIGHVAGPQNADTARRRLPRLRTRARSAGIEPCRRARSPSPRSTRPAGNVAATRLLRLEPRPTALFVGNVRAAIGAMAAAAAARSARSRTTCRSSASTTRRSRAISTRRSRRCGMPLVEMGRQAVDHLLALLNGDAVDDSMVGTPPELVVRASAAAPPGATP